MNLRRDSFLDDPPRRLPTSSMTRLFMVMGLALRVEERDFPSFMVRNVERIVLAAASGRAAQTRDSIDAVLKAWNASDRRTSSVSEPL